MALIKTNYDIGHKNTFNQSMLFFISGLLILVIIITITSMV